MSGKLKKFVSEHRQEFDTKEPAKDLWKKIDAQMDAKNSSYISSRWLSKIKYLGFGASVLVVAIYFITNQTNSFANERAVVKKDSVISHLEPALKPYQNRQELNPGENSTIKNTSNLTDNKSKSRSANIGQRTPLVHENITHKKNDFASDPLTPGSNSFENNSSEQQKNNPEGSVYPSSGDAGKTKAISSAEKKESSLARNKKTGFYVPEEPTEVNCYTGTLYEGASFRAMLRAFRFPGKVHLDKGRGIARSDENYRNTLRTNSFRHFEKMKNVSAVWLKGKTDKGLTVSLKKRFKNIILLKRDGRKLNPEAISHYYPGLWVISEYKGLYFNMIFKDKVELILFFKDAEEGDKIIIDNIIEAVIKAQP